MQVAVAYEPTVYPVMFHCFRKGCFVDHCPYMKRNMAILYSHVEYAGEIF